MNFLSHFYHEAPVSDPCFAAGIILPDILSSYSHRLLEGVKLHVNRLKDSDNEEILSLNNGVKRHYEVDRYFHESEFFEEHVGLIKLQFRELQLPCFKHRLYAFAHVTLEIMLDRKVLIEDRAKCDQMYDLLSQVRKETIASYIAFNTGASRPGEVGTHFQRFTERKFIYDYAVDDRLLEALSRINMRLGNSMFTNDDKVLIKPIIHDIEKTLLQQKFPKFRTDL